MRHILKLFSFLPAILMMYVIFNFSSAEGVDSAALSFQVSHKVVEVVDEVGDFDWSYDQIDYYANAIHGRMRKFAHMFEYAVLAVCVSFPLYVYGMHGILLMFVAGFICVAFACSDEYHQLFVAGRSGAIRDVLIDSIGIFAGIIVVRMVGFTGRMTIFKPKKKKRRQRRARYYDDDYYDYY